MMPIQMESILNKIKHNISKFSKGKRHISNLEHHKLVSEIEFYKEALNSLPNPIFIKDEQARFIFFNKAYETFFSISRESLIGKKVFDLEYLPFVDRLKYQEEDMEMIREVSQIHYEKNFPTDDDMSRESLYWSKGFEVASTGQKGLIGEIVDITIEKDLQRILENGMKQLEQAKHSIEEKAKRDPLTNLVNRTVLKEELPHLLKLAEKKNFDIAILVADLDYFKKINDTYGHIFGDKVLVEFANVLKAECRSNDLIIRYGGEEFLVILPFTNREQAYKLSQRICQSTCNIDFKSMSELINIPHDIRISTSIGVTQYIHGERFESLVIRADQAMYLAKDCGRNCVKIL